MKLIRFLTFLCALSYSRSDERDTLNRQNDNKKAHISTLKHAMIAEVDRLQAEGLVNGTGTLYQITVPYQQLKDYCTRAELTEIHMEMGHW